MVNIIKSTKYSVCRGASLVIAWLLIAHKKIGVFLIKISACTLPMTTANRFYLKI